MGVAYVNGQLRTVVVTMATQSPRGHGSAYGSAGVDYDTLDAMGAVIVGTPEKCIERVRRYRDAGCDQLLCLMQPYKIPAQKVMRSIELFGQHVIPAFR